MTSSMDINDDKDEYQMNTSSSPGLMSRLSTKASEIGNEMTTSIKEISNKTAESFKNITNKTMNAPAAFFKGHTNTTKDESKNNDNQNDKTMIPMNFRRVVTGLTEVQQSTIIADGTSPWIIEPLPGMIFHEMWETNYPNTPQSDADVLSLLTSPIIRENKLAPNPNGSIFRIVEFPPDCKWDREKVKEAFAKYGAKEAYDESHRSTTTTFEKLQTPPPSPLMHQTKSLDYAIVLKGPITCVLDNTSTVLNTGDVLIQRATSHGWSNKSKNDRAAVAFILIGTV